MEGDVRLPALRSDILRYIVEHERQPGEKLPTIQQISQELGASVAKTRESLEVARALGVVAIKPGRGTEVAEYRFTPARHKAVNRTSAMANHPAWNAKPVSISVPLSWPVSTSTGKPTM